MSGYDNNHEWLEAAALYALGALEDDALAKFEVHLVDCTICQAAVSADRETATALATVVRQIDPPAALRDRILVAARGESNESGPDITPVRPRRIPLWLAAASIMLAALGGAGYLIERTARTDAEAALAAAREELASSRLALAERDSAVAALLAPDVRFAALAAADDAPTLRVFWNESADVIVVSAFSLPRPPEGRTYQLWAIAEGSAPISLGTFDTDDAGTAIELLPVGDDVPDASVIQLAALTLEPAGGSPQPTENPRFVGGWQTAY